MERLGYVVAGAYASALEWGQGTAQGMANWAGGREPLLALFATSALLGAGLSVAFPAFKPAKLPTIVLAEAEWECTQSREIKVERNHITRIEGIPVPVVVTTVAQTCERFELKEVE